MANLWLLALCFLCGFLARRSGRFPESTPAVLNGWVLYLALPALIIGTLHALPFQAKLVLSALCLWLVFLLPAAVALAASPTLISRKTAAALALCAGLGNTAFVGLPVLEALGGKSAMSLGVVVDQLGSFLALSLLAVPFAAHMSGRHTSPRALVARLLRFPPLLALAFVLLTRPVPFPDTAITVMQRLAETLSPIALCSVGWQLRLSSLATRARPLLLGLLYKLALAPAMVLGLLLLFGGGTFGELERVTVAQAAMAPMVTASVLATEYDLEPDLVAGLLGVGVPLSLLTVPFVWRLLAALG